jgi:2-iminoacetate synthase ThiH
MYFFCSYCGLYVKEEEEEEAKKLTAEDEEDLSAAMKASLVLK